jgi:two-component system, OmpR family, copper resistance phosphate regulon response regulator CusR
MRILLIEDDTRISSFVKIGFENKKYKVDVAYESNMGERLALSKKYDIIILDVILPGGINGFELCKKLRNNNIKTPIIILTSLDSIEDKTAGFSSGADDYLLKPFSFQELELRVMALYRRYRNEVATPILLKFDDLELDTVAKKVKRSGQEIKLTAREFKLLELLMNNPGKVFERMEILEKVWGFTFNSGTNVIDVHINAIRNKIDKNFTPKLIHTVIGLGYVLKAE